jgi:hypothetical protein
MSSHELEVTSNPAPAETAPAPQTIADETTATEDAEETNVGPLLKAELYGTEKEKRLASYVTNAEATRKTAGAEGSRF